MSLARKGMDDRWVGWLRSMVLRESQILGTLEAHNPKVPEPMRSRYASLVRLARARVQFLQSALSVRGEKAGETPVALLRGVGRITGAVTSLAGPRRMLSMDIDGVRRLERSYFDAFHDKPPVDIACTLGAFIGELEAERSRLVEDVRPLFSE